MLHGVGTEQPTIAAHSTACAPHKRKQAFVFSMFLTVTITTATSAPLTRTRNLRKKNSERFLTLSLRRFHDNNISTRNGLKQSRQVTNFDQVLIVVSRHHTITHYGNTLDQSQRCNTDCISTPADGALVTRSCFLWLG